MKKILSVISILCLILSFVIPVNAAGINVSLSGNSETAVDGSVTYIVNLSGAQICTGGSIAITVGENLKLVSGEFLKNGSTLENFDIAKKKGAIAFKESVDLNGAYFKFTVKAKKVSKEEQPVSVTVTLADGASGRSSKTIKINCKTHTFDQYININSQSHKRVCSDCGYEEITNHMWNGGTVIKPANCKESGIKRLTCNLCNATKDEVIAKTNNHSWGGYKVTKSPGCTTPGTQTRTCSVCGKTENQQIGATGHSMGAWTQSKAPTCIAVGEEKRSCSKCGHNETRTIDALGHSFSHPKVIKEPTCTEPGLESGKCSRCGQEATNSIKPTGHKFGAWENIKEPTCEEGGIQKRVCIKCGVEETRNTGALGHDFENPTIIKAATISETGLKEGKCKRCGKVVSEVIPCTAKDEATGILIEADEGVFASRTELNVEEINADNPAYDSAKNILKDISGEFKLYNITATLDGVEVTPNGTFKAIFNIPDEYGKNVELYLIKADGTSERIDCEVAEDGKTLTAKLTVFGEYAICKLEENVVEVDNSTTFESPKKNNVTVYIIVAVVVIIIAAVTLYIVIKKKRLKDTDH